MDHKSIAEVMQCHIAACKASGKSVFKYCQQHEIKVHQYYYWQKKLHPKPSGKFISITPLLTTAPVSILFSNGKRICFETMPPVEYIIQLMS
ncbi:IS66 family insertion sequence element accessory protein TnpA [Candidatus Contendibacter odensensis]|uniref:IS66 family insertion sequence element accessory protein TnpA n=1 Tax=Candidatus Contendibacter odensensis TaxID=1400860 RepID=UPI003B9695FD